MLYVVTVGVVSTLAGSGTALFADGMGTSAMFNNPRGLSIDSSGVVFVADSQNDRIRRISTTGKD